MSEQQEHVASSQSDRLPWWLRFSRWLWKLAVFLGISVFLALGINVTSTWLTTPEGVLPAETPLRTLTTYWPISLLVGCCLLLLAALFWAICHWSISSRTLSVAITKQARERMLQRLRLRYEQLLSQSLQEVVQIELGLAERPAAIHNGASLLLRLPEQPEQALPPHTSIIDAYKQARQELLILGEPGAGKSTLLLELAQHLVEQAEQDRVQPIPVLLPLSSWATKRPPLQDWLIEQFISLYNVPHKLSHDWIQTDLVLPLLDGLDEMEASARPACIAAINTYHREHLQPLVVCSRTNEYDTAARHERLALHTAVVVQPLTLEQIDTFLTKMEKPLVALRMALKKNATLRMVATTPLLLQILLLIYHDIPVLGLSHKEGQLREQIWSDYVQQMVSRKGNNTCYTLEQTRTWLGWLARQMRKHDQTIFSLEQLQPNWLPKGRKAIYQWTVGLGAGLIAGPLTGLYLELLPRGFYGLRIGLVGGLVGGLGVGLGVGLLTEIIPVEVFVWSWEYLRYEWRERLLCGLLFGLLCGPLFVLLGRLLDRLLSELPVWLFVGQQGGGKASVLTDVLTGVLVVWLGTGLRWLVDGFSGEQLTERCMLSPNEGIRRSMKNGLLVGLVAGLGAGLGAGLFVGLDAGLFCGLGAALQHYILRFWLWRSHLFPLKAVPFLEDATARILLRRVGGGYSFTHRLLLKYFADLDTTPPAPSLGAHPVQHPPMP